MSKHLIIAGAGGFGRGLLGWVSGSPEFMSKYEISQISFIDDIPSTARLGRPIIGTIEDYEPSPADLFICAIGNPQIRREIVVRLKKRGARFQTFVDDRAIVGPNVSIGEGVVICPGVVISAGAKIQEQVHINFNCSIGHDTELGPFSTLSPSVNLMGELYVEDSVFFGGSATVLPRLKIGMASQIGAGAVVTKNVPERVLVKGIPGKWAENGQTTS